jgi:secreted Zn-dependent insulinase-like peptidase
MARECHAVHNEWSKNLPSDGRRIYQLTKATSNPLHPFSQFGSGNAHTLYDMPRARAAVMALFNRYYVGPNIAVVVVGTEDTATLRQWVIEEFSEVRAAPPLPDVASDPAACLPARYGAHSLLQNPWRRASAAEQRALAALAQAVPTMDVEALYPDADDANAAEDGANSIIATTPAGASVTEAFSAQADDLVAASRPPAPAPPSHVAGCNATDLKSPWRASVATRNAALAARVMRGAAGAATGAAAAGDAAATPADGAADVPAEPAAPAAAAATVQEEECVGVVPTRLIRPFPGCEGAVYSWVPVRDKRTLTLSWIIPPEGAGPGNRSGAHRVLSHLVGDEGPGSVLSVLKRKGLATGVSASGSYNHTRDFADFSVDVNLTEPGLRRLWDVAAHVYRYIGLIAAASDAELVRLQRECALERSVRFRFLSKPEPEDYASATAAALQSCYDGDGTGDGPVAAGGDAAVAMRGDLRYATAKGFVLDAFEPAHLRALLKCLVPRRARIDVCAKAYGEAPAAVATAAGAGENDCGMKLRECHYGTEYRRDLVPEWVLTSADAALAGRVATPAQFAGLALPPPNVYIPTDFSIVAPEPEPVWRDGAVTTEPPALPTQGPEWTQSTAVAGVAMPDDFVVAAAAAAGGHVLPPLRTRDEVLSWRARITAEGLPPTQTAVDAATAAAGADADADAAAGIAPAAAAELSVSLRSDPIPPRLLLHAPAVSADGSLSGGGLTLWHRTDRIFTVPRTTVFLRVVLPTLLPGDDIDAVVRADLFVALVCDALTDSTYAAQCAGLGFSLSAGARSSVDITVSGYSHTLPRLLRTVLSELCGHAVCPRRFAVFKERTLRAIRSLTVTASPLDQAAMTATQLLQTGSHTRAARLRAAEAITVDDIRVLAAGLSRAGAGAASGALCPGHVEMMVIGNASRAAALAMARDAAALLPCCPPADAASAASATGPFASAWVARASVAATTAATAPETASEPTTLAPVPGSAADAQRLYGEYAAAIARDVAFANAAVDAATAAHADGASAAAVPASVLRVPAFSGAALRAFDDAVAVAAEADGAGTAAAPAAGTQMPLPHQITAPAPAPAPAHASAQAVVPPGLASVLASASAPVSPPAVAAGPRGRPLHLRELPRSPPVTTLNAGEAALVRLPATNSAADQNSALRMYFQCLAPAPRAVLKGMPELAAGSAAGARAPSLEEQWLRVSVLACLLGRVIREPCFNSLRSKQSLAYIVHAGLTYAPGASPGSGVSRIPSGRLGAAVPFITIALQSVTHSAAELQRRVHLFLRQFRAETLGQMSEETFLKHLNAFTEEAVAGGQGSGSAVAGQTPRDVAGALWAEVSQGRADFTFAPRRLLPHARVLTRELLCAFFDAYILPPVGTEAADARRVLSVQIEHTRHVLAPAAAVDPAAGSDPAGVPAVLDCSVAEYEALWATTVLPVGDDGFMAWRDAHGTVAPPGALMSRRIEHERWAREADKRALATAHGAQ